MISLDPAKAALANLKPPSPDAAFMKTSLDLAQSGKMFQNPMAGSLDKLSGLGLDTMGSSLASIPGCADIAAKCAKVASTSTAVQGVSSQMFTSVLPTTKAVPASLMSLSPDLSSADKAKLADFTVPSITDVMSTAQAEQADNEAMGTSGDNPCLPVQKTMENAMKSATNLSNGIDDALSQFDIGGKLKSIQAAADKVKNAVGEELQAAQAALSSLVNSVSADLNKGLDAISSVVEDAGKSLVDSIKTVRDSAEKSMQLASAGMAKDLIKNNPCMKSVLSPGSGGGKPGSIGVYEYTTEFQFRNAKGDELTDPLKGPYFADLLANGVNLQANTVLNSQGYETWDHKLTVVKKEGDECIINAKITYTLDVDMALAKYASQEFPKDNITFINFFNEEKVKVGRIIAQVTLDNWATGPRLGRSGLNEIQEGILVLISEGILWSGGKKPSLLSPEMQQMTTPAPEAEVEIVPSVGEVVVKTEEQVKQEQEEQAKADEPPKVTQEPTEAIKPKPYVPKPPAVTLDLTLRASKEKETGEGWEGVTEVETNNLSDGVIGTFMTLIQTTKGGKGSPLWTVKYEMDKEEVNRVANWSANDKAKVHFQTYSMAFFKKDGTRMGRVVLYFYLECNPATGQVAFTAEAKAGGVTTPFDWDVNIIE